MVAALRPKSPRNDLGLGEEGDDGLDPSSVFFTDGETHGLSPILSLCSISAMIGGTSEMDSTT